MSADGRPLAEARRTSGTSHASWSELTTAISACRRCTHHLASDANARPLFTKCEPVRPRVLFIAEAPNLDDTVKHGHLTIDANTDPMGKLLHDLIRDELDLRFEHVPHPRRA